MLKLIPQEIHEEEKQRPKKRQSGKRKQQSSHKTNSTKSKNKKKLIKATSLNAQDQILLNQASAALNDFTQNAIDYNTSDIAALVLTMHKTVLCLERKRAKEVKKKRRKRRG